MFAMVYGGPSLSILRILSLCVRIISRDKQIMRDAMQYNLFLLFENYFQVFNYLMGKNIFYMNV